MATFTPAFGIICLISVLISAGGFLYFVYFFSVCYGFSIAGMSVAMMVLFWGGMDTWMKAICILLTVYGLRLGIYLLVREAKGSYRKIMRPETDANVSKRAPGYKFAIWLVVASLYIGQVSPVFFRIQNGTGADTCAIIGFFTALLGVVIEGASDAQKFRLKKEHPHEFCRTGLYRIVRCPNYFGEILLWTGVFLFGITSLSGFWQWFLAIWGYALILWVMFSGARRLELRQNKNYGNRPEYQEYVRKVPIIIPLAPIYSVVKHKWLVG